MRDESVKSTCLSPVLSVDLVSPGSGADIFRSLLASWPPYWPCPGPLAEAPCYLLLRELCVQGVNTAWLAEQGSNLLLILTHASTDARTHTVMWPSQGVGRDVYRATITTPGRIESHGRRDKQTQTSITPATINCRWFQTQTEQNRKYEALGWMMWQSKHPWRPWEVHPDRTWQHSLRWTLQSAGLTRKHVLR